MLNLKLTKFVIWPVLVLWPQKETKGYFVKLRNKQVEINREKSLWIT